MKTVANCTIIIIALACSIVMFLLIKPFLLSSTGTFGPTILQAQSPGPAIVAILVAMAVGTLIACLVSRLLTAKEVLLVDVFVRLPASTKDIFDPRESRASTRSSATSMLILGLGLGWTALQLESVQTVILDGSMGLLAAEGIAWALALLVIAFIVCRFGGPFIKPMQNDDGDEDDWAMSTAALKMAASGACVLPVVWLIAQSPMKGQVLMATIIGATAAGLVGRLLAPTVQPILIFASVCVFGALGHWVAGFMMPTDLATVVATNQLPNLVLPLPIDYAAGSLVGVPIGIAWANGFLEKDDTTNQAAAA